MTDVGLIIMVRKPELGKVKTRLAQDLGPKKALAIYKALLQYTKEVCDATPVDKYVYYHEAIEDKDLWSASGYTKRLQCAGSLGDKMKAALVEVLHTHQYAIIIGSDCPRLSPAVLDQAQAALRSMDVVVGPTLDGGYYLLGLRQVEGPLLDDIPWSSGTEYETTLRRAIGNGRSVMALQALPDIDYRADWEAYGWPLQQDEGD